MKAYLFDLDGTLLESTGIWAQIDRDFLGKRGLCVPPDYAEAIRPFSFRETAEYTVNRFSLPDTPEDLMAEWRGMAREAYGQVALKPYAKEYLAALRDRGVRLGIATSLTADLYIPALTHHGLMDWFEVHCSTDEVGCGKDRPDVFLLAAERLGVDPKECALFDDILPAIRAAKGVGMTAYGVYDAASAEEWAAMVREADGVVMSWRPLAFGQKPLKWADTF